MHILYIFIKLSFICSTNYDDVTSLLHFMFISGFVCYVAGAGITEPIGVNLKAGRGGLGREVAQKEKRHRQEVCRQQETKVSLEEYRKRVRSKMEDRQLESDLRKSQCACQQLDAQAGVNCPVDAWFWVQEKKKEEESEEEEKEDREEDEKSEKDDDDEEKEEEENDEPNSHEKLAKLTEYLRTRHLYCVWCGTSYDDADDLASNCPGDTAEDHD
uniref:G patch domain containing 11 n=1 Tax=Eptatretus burgeri TaxID=7764 RepID=A0A8C4NAT2_EPTBU